MEQIKKKIEETQIPHRSLFSHGHYAPRKEADVPVVGFGPSTGHHQEKEEKKKENDDDQEEVVLTAGGVLPRNHAYDYRRDGQARGNEQQLNFHRYVGNHRDDPPPVPSPVLQWVQDLDTRLTRIERCLAPSSCIKVTPISNLVCMDTKSQDTIHRVYKNWTTYMRYIAQKIEIPKFPELFWAADQFVFQRYFANASPTHRFVLDKVTTDSHQDQPMCMQYTIEGGTVHVYYNVAEFRKRQPPLDYDYSTRRSLISGVDACTMPIAESQPIRDARHRIMGGHRILYNTIVDTSTLEDFKSSVYDAGKERMLDICIWIVHRMLHIKCSMQFADPCIDHSCRRFLAEVIYHIPPVMFGHPAMNVKKLREDDVNQHHHAEKV